MPENHETTFLSGRQFSIRTLLILMCAVAVAAALIAEYGFDLKQLCIALIPCCLWSTLLVALAGVRRFLLAGFLLGLFAAGLNFLFFTCSPDLVEMVLVPFGLPLLVLNIFSLAYDFTSGTWASAPNVNIGCRKVVAKKSLFALSLMPLAFMLEGFESGLILGLSLLATMPWPIFWRRRRLAGNVFPKNWIDKFSWGLSGFAFWFAVISAIPIVLLLSAMFFEAPFSIGFALISTIGFYYSNFIALALVMISWAIQLFRDRWWCRLNWLAILWLTLVYVAHATITL